MHDRRHVNEPLRFGPFELDLRTRELRKDGRRIRLQDKPFEVLATLLDRPNDIVTRDELRRRLWPADTFVVFDDSLNTAIRKAREALGDSAEAPRFIETVPRHGYRFIGPLNGSDRGAREAVAMVPAPALPAGPPVEPYAPVEPAASRAGSNTQRWPVAGAAVLAIAAAVLAASVFALRSRPGTSAAVVRFQLEAPASAGFTRSSLTSAALSPDGRRIAFTAASYRDRTTRIWLQALNSDAARLLPGTERAVDMCWSPDGQAIAFSAHGQLLRYDLRNEIVTRLADALALGVTWSAESGILYGRGEGHGLYRVSAEGGTAAAVTTLDASREETMHAWPQWLPDGQSFLFVARSRRPENDAVYLAHAGDRSRRLVLEGGYRVMYAEPGFLLFPEGSRLLAQRFDAGTATLRGAATEVATGIATVGLNGAVGITAAASDALAYSSPYRLPSREVVWVNRAGQAVATVAAADHYASFSLSPDERFTTLQRMTPEIFPPAPDLWVLDLARNVRTRLTNGPANDEGGVWAPDSRRFAYARHRGVQQPADLYMKDVLEPDREQPLLVDDAGSKHPFDWAPDGRSILYGLAQPNSPRQDIWVLPLDENRPAFPWLATEFDESEARFSPNGRWIAYESDETGRREVFVRSFASPRVRVQISAGGGTKPEWRQDGRELYYVAQDYRLTAVLIGGGATLDPGPPTALFELRRLQPAPDWSTPYAPRADGQRFLVGAVVDEGAGSPVTVVLNWTRLVGQWP